MKSVFATILAFLSILALAVPATLPAQGKPADYQRADALRDRLQGQVRDAVDQARWIGKSHSFWYHKSGPGGGEYIRVDADTQARQPAFDLARLTAALGAATGESLKPDKLQLWRIEFKDPEKAMEIDFAGSRWRCDLVGYQLTKLGPARPFYWDDDGPAPDKQEPKLSPDGKTEAYVRNYNVCIRPKGSRDREKEEKLLSRDGSEGDAYTLRSLCWSPDSRYLAAYRVRPGYQRKVHYVESSPADQLQPKHSEIEYAKPGDVLDTVQPVIFEIASGQQRIVANDLFPNAYEMSDLEWWKDGRALTFEYNQRGHQVYRVIEVDPRDGRARALVDEQAKTFFCYSGKRYRYDVADGREIVWMSERDGWNHLYLYDGASGAVKNPITRGPWVVRRVDRVDEAKRQIWFQASGMNPGQDPYFLHAYRVNFDGSGLTALTSGDANHTVAYSDDMSYFVDTYSRVDLPPVCELRRADGSRLMTVERADIGGLTRMGWRPPEVFVAKGRDGRTDIWGVIVRPLRFDKSRRYPVIEDLYAGPQDSFVPKSFSAYNSMMALAELGFIVVKVDGMGTANRSKAFHDVCWKNLGDAGLPDRILWHRAAAARYPQYDISRVGVYGTSAGGQSSLGALLFHPEFYKVAVSSCGCHDNRMDKIWWNEQWMGWPIGPEYAASSNVDNAWRLRGKLLLFVGELDDNVDPSSTMQVVNALIKAGKEFQLLVLPGQKHTAGGEYGERRRRDFFVKNLLGIDPPDWNRIEQQKKAEN